MDETEKQKARTKLKNCRVLVVEDETLQAVSLAQLLTEIGAQVIGIATSVPAALAELSTKSYDVVCLDVNMSGMLTVGMARSLKDMGIPLVFCTAYGHTIEKYVEAPIIDKPIRKEALVEALLTVLQDHPLTNKPAAVKPADSGTRSIWRPRRRPPEG